MLAAILVSALGYFVDCYDMLLFSSVRKASLTSLGLEGAAIMSTGVFLLNVQLVGMLVGGLLWGMLGDKYGRTRILWGSILTYSLATLLNALVTSVAQYAALRFIAGVGLAGELGAGITLVAELMPAGKRGLGTMLVVFVGVLGSVSAGLVGDILPWRSAYLLGGILGLVLLAARISLEESDAFKSSKLRQGVSRGSLGILLGNWGRFSRILALCLAGVPIWFMAGLLVTLAPEVTASLEVSSPLTVGSTLIVAASALAIGDLFASYLSQRIGSRRRVMLACILMNAIVVSSFLACFGAPLWIYYIFYALMGLTSGYWVTLITMAAEQFGTNLRATVTTSVPNFVRATNSVTSLAFFGLQPELGVLPSLQLIAWAIVLLAAFSVVALPETFGRDLNFEEV